MYRVTRGHFVPQFVEIDEPLWDSALQKPTLKNVFVVYFNAEHAMKKIQKICESLGASLYDFPEHDTKKVLHQVNEKIKTFDSVRLFLHSGTHFLDNRINQSTSSRCAFVHLSTH